MQLKMHFKRQQAHSRGKKKNATKKPKDIQQLCLLPRNATALINHPLLQVLWIVEDTARMFYFRIFDFRRFTSQSNYSIFCQELFVINFHK